MTFASRHARLSFREAFLIRISSLENAGMEPMSFHRWTRCYMLSARGTRARARAPARCTCTLDPRTMEMKCQKE